MAKGRKKFSRQLRVPAPPELIAKLRELEAIADGERARQRQLDEGRKELDSAMAAEVSPARRNPSPPKPTTCERFIDLAMRDYPQQSGETERAYKARLFARAGSQWTRKTFDNLWSGRRKKR
jgi:hypothetical protein